MSDVEKIFDGPWTDRFEGIRASRNFSETLIIVPDAGWGISVGLAQTNPDMPDMLPAQIGGSARFGRYGDIGMGRNPNAATLFVISPGMVGTYETVVGSSTFSMVHCGGDV